MTAARQFVQLSEQDFDQTVEAVSRVRIPRRFDPHSAASRRQLGNALQNRIASLSTRPAWLARAGSITELADQIAELHAVLRAHPLHMRNYLNVHLTDNSMVDSSPSLVKRQLLRR